MSVTKSVRARDDKVDDLRIVETSHTRFIIDVDVTYVRDGASRHKYHLSLHVQPTRWIAI